MEGPTSAVEGVMDDYVRARTPIRSPGGNSNNGEMKRRVSGMSREEAFFEAVEENDVEAALGLLNDEGCENRRIRWERREFVCLNGCF